MRIAFFSDIHGNLPALEIAVKDACNVDGYIILGDVVNYGPWSNECVEKIETLPNCKKVCGNHEGYFIKGEYCGENYLANLFFNQCYKNFKGLSLIKRYKFQLQFEDFICIHTIDDKYLYEDTNIILDKNYIIGHSHRQYKINNNGYILINPGSLGQNRQYINEINYMIYDSISKNIDFRSVLYNVEILINKMIKMDYPKECLDYYINKPRR